MTQVSSVSIRSSPSLQRFRSALKTHLFREDFNKFWFSCVNREFYQRPWSFVTYGKGAIQVENIIIIISELSRLNPADSIDTM